MKDEHYLKTEIRLFLLTQKFDRMGINATDQTFILHLMFKLPTDFFEDWIHERERRLKMSKILQVQGMSLLDMSVNEIRKHTKASPNDIIFMRKTIMKYSIPDQYKSSLDQLADKLKMIGE